MSVVAAILSSMALLSILAVLTEAVTEVVKRMFPNQVQDKVTYFVSIAVGIVLAFALGVNFLGLTGFGFYVSVVAAGLIASRGANYVNGYLKQLGVISPAAPTPEAPAAPTPESK